MDDENRGSGVLHHQSQHDGFVAAEGPRPGFPEAIDRHIEEYFGPVEFVYHEMISHLVAAHVHVIAPTPERPFRTLITSGMSERPMAVPEGHGISPFAEVMIALPPDWDLTDKSDESRMWPVTLLRDIARFPHQYGTWIGTWHTIPNGNPAEPYAPGVPFTSVVVAPMLWTDEQAHTVEVGDGHRIDILALVPLHPAEAALKREQGTDALLNALSQGRVSELLTPDRPSFAG